MQLVLDYKANGASSWETLTETIPWQKKGRKGQPSPFGELQVALNDESISLEEVTGPFVVVAESLADLSGSMDNVALVALLLRVDGQTFKPAGTIRMKPA